jgi:uncharacterized protein YycO
MAISSRPILDPSGPSPLAAEDVTPPGPIPPSVRQFGYLPDVGQCRPGDLLLFSALTPSWVSKRIINAQIEGGYGQRDAYWHHAAVYIGRYTICEAQGRKVRVGPLYDYVGSHRILIRRDQALDSNAQWEIAINAMDRLRQPYALMTALKLGWQSRRGFWRLTEITASGRAAICSQLYSEAYSKTTGKFLIQGKLGILIPADLSLADRLTDIQVDWLKIS